MKRRLWPLAALPLALLGLSAVLLIALGRAPEPWTPGADETAAAPTPAARASAKSSETAFDPPPEAAFDIVVARNLFAVDRAPPADEPVAGAASGVGAPVAESAELELTGVVRGEDRAAAILRDRRSGETLRLGEGERYRGWALTEVNSASVRLRRQDRETRLELRFAPDAAPNPAQRRSRDPTVRIGPDEPLPVQPRRSDGAGNPVPAARQPEERGGGE